MYVYSHRYYSNGGNKYRVKYMLRDENGHTFAIDSSEKQYKEDSAEQRLIQSLISETTNIEQAEQL